MLHTLSLFFTWLMKLSPTIKSFNYDYKSMTIQELVTSQLMIEPVCYG